MRQLAVLLLVLTILGSSLQQQQAENSPPEDAKKAKKLTDSSSSKGENKKRDNKKVSKKMLKASSGETESLEAGSGEDGHPDPGADIVVEDYLPNTRTRLRDLLLKNYSKDVHPVKSHKSRIQVDVGMALIHIGLDELTSVLEVDAWMRLTWTDEYLAWNQSDYEGLDQIHFGSEEIWKPDILLYNSAESGKIDQYGRTHFLVFHTGEVLWVPPAKFKSFCKIDLKLWPLESQTCKMKFGSWTSHGDQIDLGLYHNMTKTENLNFYTDNKEWFLVDTMVTRNRVQYECCPEPYPDVTFAFKLQRRSPMYRCAIILPCLITMLLVVSSFLLPPTAGEKILINATSLIVCVLYLLYFSSTLPALSDHIPLIVLFYSNTAALVGIAIVLNVCCISISRDQRYSSPPKFLRNLFTGFVGKLLCLGNYYHQVSGTHHRLLVEMDQVSESPECEQTTTASATEVERSCNKDWQLVAAGIERFFFLIYTIAFAIVSSAYI